MKKSRKIYIIFFFIGLVFASYCGYLVAGAWYEGVPTDELFRRLMYVFENPFCNYRNSNTLTGILIAWGVYGIVFLMYITSLKNLMPGKEFGTARWEEPEKVTKKFGDKKDEFNNMIISKKVRISINDRKTKRNDNVLVVGGSGSGKTFYFAKPNILQMNSSLVITDCKGEIYRTMAPVLLQNGYRVITFNMIDPEKSDCYNPFAYIRKETDVIRLITNLITNTTPKNSTQQDPFWEKAETLFLQSLFFYVWMELPKARRNFESVFKLLKEAEVTDGKKQSELDRRFARLERKSPLGSEHPALVKYRESFSGASDTVRTILISARARLSLLQNKEILRVLSRDDMNIAEFGTGVNGDGKTKTALFCIIPDNDKSYNFLVGMLYTQIFQELYYQADFMYKNGRLPIHVEFKLDEFVNVALPDDFCSLLSTMRGRNISCTIIIQNMAQIKALFDKTWETIPGNCDTFVYLGGNEQSTFEYINKLLDKKTIDKKTHGESRGRNSSSSKNFDVLGRDMMTQGEIRKLDDSKCLIFIRGVDPVIDDKYVPFEHPRFYQSGDADESLQADMEQKAEQPPDPEVVILNADAVKYYKRLQKRGENIRIDSIDAMELLCLSEEEFISGKRNRQLTDIVIEEEPLMEIINPETDTGTERPAKEKTGETITDRMLKYDFSEEQFEEAKLALKAGISESELLLYFYPDKSVEMLKKSREQLLKNL